MYSGKDPVSGCMGGVLRRFLCVKLKLNLHSSTGRFEKDLDGCLGLDMEKKKPNSTPGVVARLMGLDSSPPVITGRSRSMGEIGGESLVMVNDGVSLNGLKKFSSFKEVPTFLREENEDFFVLSFGGDDGEKEEEELKVDACLLEMGEEFEDSKDGRRLKIARRIEEKKMKICSSSSFRRIVSKNLKKPIDSEEGILDFESSSENSSPVSVLDRALESKDDEYFSIDLQRQEPPLPGYFLQVSDFRQRSFDVGNYCSSSTTGDEEGENPRQRNPRRSTSPEVNSSLISDREQKRPTSLIRQDDSSSRSRRRRRRRTRREAELWGEICRFAVEDSTETTNWAFRNQNNIKHLEDLNVSIESYVLDFLIQDLVQELLFSSIPSSKP